MNRVRRVVSKRVRTRWGREEKKERKKGMKEKREEEGRNESNEGSSIKKSINMIRKGGGKKERKE